MLDMITNEQIKKCIDDCAKKKYNISVRDIAIILLSNEFGDKRVAYRSIFANNSQEDYENYFNDDAIKYLADYVGIHFIYKVADKKRKTADISFEENKEYMLKLKADTEKAMENGEIDKKDGLKILTDISVKLNDKFSVNDTNNQRVVIVNKKFNAICDCGREIYVPTKEDLMEKYNLIEK